MHCICVFLWMISGFMQQKNLISGSIILHYRFLDKKAFFQGAYPVNEVTKTMKKVFLLMGSVVIFAPVEKSVMEMKNIAAVSALMVMASFAAFAQESKAGVPENTGFRSDTSSVAWNDELNEVVVTGTRNETDVRHLSQTVSVIGRDKIVQTVQPSLLPVLTEQIPGLFITSRGIMGYGVSDGAAGGMSLRGLSGGSGRLMVLIDGHPQYMGMFSHPIADAYQSFLAERVEVLRGPASMLYGSNAMGGVINIVTRRMKEDGVRTDLNAGYGSFNTLQTDLSNRIRKGRFSSVASLSYNKTDGHRDDMGFEQYGGYAKTEYEIDDAWKVSADVNITHFNASQPGPVSAPLIDADQRVTRGMASFALENDYGKTSGAVSFFYNWGRHKINDGYEPSAGESPLDYRFNSKDDMMGISVYQSVRLFKGNRLTVGTDWFRVGGRAWNAYVAGGNSGRISEIADKTEHEVAGYVDFRQNFGSWLTLDAGVRVDHHSHAGTEWVPQAGLSFHLPHSMELKASASKGFRYPTIREMYMFPPQNPDLEPESMWNYELAFSRTLPEGRLSYGANVFFIDGKNMIMTVPREGATPLNMNTGAIRNAGVEAQVAWRISRVWSADANYSFLHMENPVIAAPEHKLYAGAAFAKGRWSASTGLQYVKGLYTRVATEGNGTDIQENFLLWNLYVSFKITGWLSLWARGENLLAQKYEINAGYPMPRATAIGGISIRL